MRYLFIVLPLLLPVVSFADATDLVSIIGSFQGILGNLVKAATAVALLVFIWGIVKMLMGMSESGSDAGKVISEGKQRMVWGVVALFCIVSLWGIVVLLVQIFGVSTVANQDPVRVEI